MRRREFITLVSGAAASWPLATSAQQTVRMRRIGVLMNLRADDPIAPARFNAFVLGLGQAQLDAKLPANMTRWTITTCAGRLAHCSHAQGSGRTFRNA